MRTKANKYNRYNLEEINKNLPKNMIERHRKDYLNNCKEVIKRQKGNFNLNEIEGLKNYNFNLIKLYNNF